MTEVAGRARSIICVLIITGFAFLLHGCAGGDSGESTSSAPSSNGGGGAANYGTAFVGNETSEASFVLTNASPRHLDPNDHFTLTQTQQIWAFTASEFSAKIYALDAANAQLFLNGQAFQGYVLGGQGFEVGMHFPTLPPGTYYIGTIPGQTPLPAGYVNRVFHEVAFDRALPAWQESSNVPHATGRNPGGWESVGFTFPSGDVRAYIETESSGGKFMVMTADQHQAFSAAYLRNGYTGGGYAYTYACGGQSGGPATEIECEVQLPPGEYFLLYLNDTGVWAGGAANIQFYVPE